MAYATLSDLQARYGDDELLQLTDRDGDSFPDAAVYEPALADASAEIDGYVGAVRDVPLSLPPPALIVLLTCEIARYRLWQDAASEEVRARYEDAVAKLRDIAARRMQVPGLDPAQGPASAPQISAPGRVFGSITP